MKYMETFDYFTYILVCSEQKIIKCAYKTTAMNMIVKRKKTTKYKNP